tara:strand:+ start:53883 stop:54089 length:207 start_codon:yes stop_codon:yes gene_type:complete
VGQHTLQLRFGASCLELHHDGTMSFRNANSEMKLMANGDVKVAGKKINQQSEEDIYLKAKGNIHVNSI